MDSMTKYVLVVVVCALALFSVAILTVATTSQDGSGVVVKGNSWKGGDLQTYFNATIAFKGHTFQMVFPCDYYTVGSKLTVHYDALNGYEVINRPVGCISI